MPEKCSKELKPKGRPAPKVDSRIPETVGPSAGKHSIINIYIYIYVIVKLWPSVVYGIYT